MPLFRTRKVDKEESQRRLQRSLVVAEESPEPSLNLTDCGITELPKDVYSLCRVLRKEIILLCDNDLSSIKDGGNIKDLADVKVLDIRDNRLTSLPNDIDELKSLEVLNVQNNKLKYLPKTIGGLKSLHSINLQGNNLQSLPDEIGNLPNLKTLNVCDNPKLHSLPASLAYCRLLENIQLDSHVVTVPPRDIAKQGTVAILKYFSQCAGIEYVPSSKQVVSAINNSKAAFKSDDGSVDKAIEETLHQHDVEKEHKQDQMTQLEKQIEELNNEQRILANKATKSHEDLIDKIRQAEADMDDDILWEQSKLDALRQNRNSALAADELQQSDLVAMILQINERENNKDAILDEMERERIELDQLIDVTQEESEKLRREEVLASMAKLLATRENQDRLVREYQSSREGIAKEAMKSEAEDHTYVWDMLTEQDKDKEALRSRLSQEALTQMHAIQALQLQQDTKHCRLRGQIKILEDELAQVTLMEVDKREERQDNEKAVLKARRGELSSLLGQLIMEQEKREHELMDRLVEMEEKRVSDVEDYWLIQYQRLLDKKPASLLEKECDPEVVEVLKEAKAQDYTALFARHRVTWKMLKNMSTEELKEMGIREVGIRKAIIEVVESREQMDKKAVDKEKEIETTPTEPEPSHPIPSAPPAEIPILRPTGPSAMYSECVVCLDKRSDVVLLNCGHVCCCFECSSILQCCPICRSQVLQRIKIYVA